MTFVATNFYSLMVCRFLVGAAHMTVSHLPYMLGKYTKLLFILFFPVSIVDKKFSFLLTMPYYMHCIVPCTLVQTNIFGKNGLEYFW